SMAPWRERVLRTGFRSTAVLPIRLFGQPVATLAVYSESSDFFGTQEMALLEEAANDVSFALENFQRETDRRVAETDRRESDERFRATFEQAAVGIAHIAADGTFLRINQKLCAITGYPHEELLRKTIVELTHPDFRAETEEAGRAMLARSRDEVTSERQYV